MPAEAIGLIASLVVLVIALAMAAGGRSREEVADERHCPHYMIPGRSPVQYVREFHLTYGAAIRTEPIARPPERMMRFNLLQEELDEYAHAVDTNDVVEVADALADIVYVAYGAALTHGIADVVGSVEVGKWADLVLWEPEFFGVKPTMVLKGGRLA